MENNRLVKLSDIRPREFVPLDSLKKKSLGATRDISTLLQAREYWNNLKPVFKEGERCVKYYLGDGWSDIVEVNGKPMREDDYIKMQGKVPLQYNLIRRLGRNVVGIYREDNKEPICVARDGDEQILGDTMSELLGYVWQLNKSEGLYARGLESFLCWGWIAHRHWHGWNLVSRNMCDCWQERLENKRQFWDTNAMRDDLSDARMVGYIHDMSIEKVCEEFASSQREFQQLHEIYKYASNRGVLQNMYERFGYREMDDFDFFMPSDPTKCRVIEVWTLEQKPRYHCHDWMKGECYKVDVADYRELVVAENQRRMAMYTEAGVPEDEIPLIESEWMMDSYWYYRFYTPTGIVIKEGETPYNHGGHPFVFKLYPMINGEIRSFVADTIDVQKSVNRLITKYDWILSASAQGLVMVPEESISDKMSLDEIAENWAKFNGVIVYKSKNGAPAPHQVSTNATNIGIMELLNVQLKLVEDISSVNGALQGKQGYAGMSGALFAQQTQNSTKGLLDLLETYGEFVCDNAKMDVKNIQQFYDINKVIKIAGNDSADITLTAQKVLNVDYDLSVVQSTSSPSFKERGNEWLMQLLQMGAINLEQALDVGKFPFGEQLKQALKVQKEQMANGQTPDAISPELMGQVQQGANMDAVNQLYEAIKNSSNQEQTGGVGEDIPYFSADDEQQGLADNAQLQS